jgi:phosphoglycerate dehydrogenase-like enzyme
MKQFKILLLDGIPNYGIDYLRSKLPSNFTLTENLEDANFILGGNDCIVKLSNSPEDIMVASRKVKLIQSTGAGYDAIDVGALSRGGIPFATNDGANSVAVAEHTIMLILALFRQLIKHHNSLRAGNYVSGPEAERFELACKTVGVIGLGRIGREVFTRLKPFDVKINYYDIFRQEDIEKELGAGYLPQDELLKTSDIVSIHVPLTDETKGLIGERELKLMKPTAILINTARGPIVDEQALYKSLWERRIGGAGIDAWADEGLLRQGKRKSPLWELDNIVITPHIAGPTYDTVFRRVNNAIANFVRVANGEIAHSVIVRLRCPKCGYVWDALSHRAYEFLCPKCRVKAVELYTKGG